MLKRAADGEDPAANMIEFPGGRREKGEGTLEAAKREWSEEIGLPVPRGRARGSYIGSNAIYCCHVWLIKNEADLDLGAERSVPNPDGVNEQKAWVDPASLKRIRNLRPELRRDSDRALRALECECKKCHLTEADKRWITLDNDQRVLIDGDGKIHSGVFAGATLKQAFGKGGKADKMQSKKAPKKSTPAASIPSHDAVVAQHKKLKDGVKWSPEEQRATQDYIRRGAREIAATSRGVMDEVDPKRHARRKKQVELIKQAMANNPAPEAMTVYRGVKNDSVPAVGEEIDVQGFASTSNDPHIGGAFAGKNGVVYEMKVPEGHPALPAMAVWQSKKATAALKKGVVGESEVLLSDISMKVTGVREEEFKAGKRSVVTVEVGPRKVGGDAPAASGTKPKVTPAPSPGVKAVAGTGMPDAMQVAIPGKDGTLRPTAFTTDFIARADNPMVAKKALVDAGMSSDIADKAFKAAQPIRKRLQAQGEIPGGKIKAKAKPAHKSDLDFMKSAGIEHRGNPAEAEAKAKTYRQRVESLKSGDASKVKTKAGMVFGKEADVLAHNYAGDKAAARKMVDAATRFHSRSDEEDVFEVADFDALPKSKQTKEAALAAFVSGSFTQINQNPDLPVSRKMKELVDELPEDKSGRTLYRALGFDSDQAVDDFVASLEKPQERTLSSWTYEDATDPELSPMDNIGLDLASSFGDKTVILEYEKPKGAKNISYGYSDSFRSMDTEAVLPAGHQFKIKGDRVNSAGRRIITVGH